MELVALYTDCMTMHTATFLNIATFYTYVRSSDMLVGHLVRTSVYTTCS